MNGVKEEVDGPVGRGPPQVRGGPVDVDGGVEEVGGSVQCEPEDVDDQETPSEDYTRGLHPLDPEVDVPPPTPPLFGSTGGPAFFGGFR